MNGNLIIKNAAELVTCSGFAAKKGKEMTDLHTISDGALVIKEGVIAEVGKTKDIVSRYEKPDVDLSEFDIVDARGKAVLPGFVDSHTHFVFGGYRAEEFSWRLRGDSYPVTAFSLKEPYAPGRKMIDSNCTVALATDFNPGSCFTESIPLVFSLATLYMDISIEEAVTALTLNAAAALDRADKIGSIDVGKEGDVIILEFPSYQFIAYHIGISTVEKVVKKGNLVFDKEKRGMTYC